MLAGQQLLTQRAQLHNRTCTPPHTAPTASRGGHCHARRLGPSAAPAHVCIGQDGAICIHDEAAAGGAHRQPNASLQRRRSEGRQSLKRGRQSLRLQHSRGGPASDMTGRRRMGADPIQQNAMRNQPADRTARTCTMMFTTAGAALAAASEMK